MCPPVASTPSPPTGQNHVVHGTLQSHRGVPLPRRKYPPAFHFLSGFPVKSISREYFISEPKNPALIIFPKTDSFTPGAPLLIVHTSAQVHSAFGPAFLLLYAASVRHTLREEQPGRYSSGLRAVEGPRAKHQAERSSSNTKV